MNVLGYRNLFATLEMRMKLKQKCARICFWDRYWGGADQILGTLRSNDADGNENVKKKKKILLAKQQLCTCTMLFCTFLCSFLHDYDVNLPNFAFYGGRKQATTKFYFSFCTWIWCLGIQLQEGSPTFDKVIG